MRISSNMQRTSMMNMQNSKNYKALIGEAKNKSDSTTNKKTDTKKITSNISLERSDGKLTLTKIGKNSEKEIIGEVEATSKAGRELSKYFESNESSDLKSKLDEINDRSKTMSLANYL